MANGVWPKRLPGQTDGVGHGGACSRFSPTDTDTEADTDTDTETDADQFFHPRPSSKELTDGPDEIR